MKILTYKLNKDLKKYTKKDIKSATLKIDGNKYNMLKAKYMELEPGIYSGSVSVKYQDNSTDSYRFNKINLEIPKQYSIRLKFYDSKDNFRNIFKLPIVWIILVLAVIYSLLVSIGTGQVQLLPLFIVVGLILFIPSSYIYEKKGRKAFYIVFE